MMGARLTTLCLAVAVLVLALPWAVQAAPAEPVVVEQVVVLDGHWNFISLRVAPRSDAVADVLAGIDGQYDLVLGQEGLSPERWEAGLAYWVRLTVQPPVALRVRGVPLALDAPMALREGENWIAYAPADVRGVAEVLAGIDGPVYAIWGQSEFYHVGLSPDLQSLERMRPGEGYMVVMDGPGVLRYRGGDDPTGEAGAGLDAAEEGDDGR